jgi:hypothetical protein
LIAELYAVPRVQRPLWVVEQLEVALFEGLAHRVSAALRRLAGRCRARVQTDDRGVRVRKNRRHELANVLMTLMGALAGLAGLAGEFRSWRAAAPRPTTWTGLDAARPLMTNRKPADAEASRSRFSRARRCWRSDRTPCA